MSISLYAIGQAKIEIGRYYGMSNDQAIDLFSDIFRRLGIEPLEVTRELTKTGEHITRFSFPYNGYEAQARNMELISAMANIADIHGDAPDRYELVCESENELVGYRRTGWYND